jgi:hypothetical protein
VHPIPPAGGIIPLLLPPRFVAVVSAVLAFCPAFLPHATAVDPLNKGTGMPVADVWSGCSVGFCLLNTDRVQVAAYYNARGEVSLSARNLDSKQWRHLTPQPPSSNLWDSHNYLTMTLDSAGHLHLAGNLHRHPMNYWRSTEALTDAAQFDAPGFMEKLPVLVNANEEMKSTYPNFLTGPGGGFLFTYRNHTGKNAGDWHLLKYNPDSQTYAPAAGMPVFQWTGHYSVYPAFEIHGDFLHCLWVWRKTTDADTNYNISYMRSRDLAHWTDAFDRPLPLPVTPPQTLPTIDPVPIQGGLLNGQPAMAFDHQANPVVAYHKYDARGFSQVYVAKPDADAGDTWKILPLTTNDQWKWNFSGGGSLPPGGRVGNSFVQNGRTLEIKVSMVDNDGTKLAPSAPYTVDTSPLKSSDENPERPVRSPPFKLPDADPAVPTNPYTHDGQRMTVRRQWSVGSDPGYYLRWETLPTHRDRPRLDPGTQTPISPPPSTLMLYRCEHK